MKLAVAVALVALTGCIAGSKKPGYAIGGATAAAGVLLIASTQQRDCSSMEFGDALSCGGEELGSAMLGTYALLAGMGLLTLTAIIPAPGADDGESGDGDD